ncbi:hypothetical protein AB0I81_26090 [Nonomuraea sp. NPDC050404]|uniref:hypothetical protein n=1 Tax=Nonomuraea sp. NPDC050404 TaxID=3155783 RepID=UPI0033E9672B
MEVFAEAVIDAQREDIERIRGWAEEGRQPQARWVADGHLDDLRARLAWSRENVHLFGR